MAEKRVYFFGGGKADGNTKMKELLGGKGNLTIRHPDCDHNFPDEIREAAYRTIDSVLRPELARDKL